MDYTNIVFSLQFRWWRSVFPRPPRRYIWIWWCDACSFFCRYSSTLPSTLTRTSALNPTLRVSPWMIPIYRSLCKKNIVESHVSAANTIWLNPPLSQATIVDDMPPLLKNIVFTKSLHNDMIGDHLRPNRANLYRSRNKCKLLPRQYHFEICCTSVLGGRNRHASAAVVVVLLQNTSTVWVSNKDVTSRYVVPPSMPERTKKDSIHDRYVIICIHCTLYSCGTFVRHSGSIVSIVTIFPRGWLSMTDTVLVLIDLNFHIPYRVNTSFKSSRRKEEKGICRQTNLQI